MATCVVSGIFNPAHIDISQLDIVRKNMNKYANMLRDDLASKNVYLNELSLFYKKLSNLKTPDSFNIQRAKQALDEATYERDLAFKTLEPVRMENSICNLFCEFVTYAYSVYDIHALEKIYDAIDIASALKDRRDVMVFWSSVD